jgi:hypothetical protein
MKIKDRLELLLNDHREAKAEALRWSIFSNDVARGEQVSIVRRGVHTLQVVRHAGSEGGILAYTYAPSGQASFTSIHNWEKWYSWAKETEPYCKENEQLREAAFKMLEYVQAAQRKVGLSV